MKRALLVGLLLLGLAAAGCGSSGGDAGHAAGEHPAHAAGSHHHGGHSTGEGEVPGEPVDPSEATHDIQISASDQFRFDPSTVDVSPGEAVTFVIHNDGGNEHEFVLGDEAYQQAHEADMQGGHHMAETANGVIVAPGETKRLTWRFDHSGEVLFGCHEPGHYEGGMVGTIEVG
jgi:uncharacterized cupredoxin-like copper-binding protein